MSRAAEVTFTFGGEERLFRLPIGRLRALQEKVDCGPYELHRRLLSGLWRVDDVRETYRQGLIGGGMEVGAVDKLLSTEFDGLPLNQFVPGASVIMLAVLSGVEDEPLGEPEAGAEETSRSREESSASPASTSAAS